MSEFEATEIVANLNENQEIPAHVEPQKLNDAIIVGQPSEEALALSLCLGQVKSAKDKRCPAKSMTYHQLIVGLSKHVEGEKDGKAFIQGTAIGNERSAKAADAFYVAGLDVDSGIWPQTVIEKLTKLDLTGIIYTTHSNLKRETFLIESAFNQWRAKEKIDHVATEAPADHVKRYLLEKRKWEPWLVETVAVPDERSHTADGMGWLLSHDPVPKFRIVFPLNEPFVIAKQRMSQAEAGKLWKRKLTGLAHVLELPIDEACLDLARLFYLPRHIKGSEFGVWITGGHALDFEAIPEGNLPGERAKKSDDVFASAGDDLAAKGGSAFTVNGFSLKRWARECAADFDISALFRECAPGKVRNDQNSSKLTVECPFDHAHGNADDPDDQGCYVQSPTPETGLNSFVFSCSHNSCKGHDRLEYMAEAVSQGWFTVENLKSADFRMGVVEADPDGDGGLTFYDKNEAIAAMNKVAAVIQMGGNTAYLVCQEKGEELNFKTKQAASDWFANWRYVYTDDKDKLHDLPVFDIWLKSGERRQYNKVVFRPDGVKNPKHYNTWTGFAVAPKRGDWTLLKRHLFEVWCDCDPDLFEYTCAWFAQMFQEPEEKPGVALFVVGNKGTGKSVVKRAFDRILDDYMTVLSASGALTDSFNDYMKRRLLVVGEEVIFPGNRAAIGPLKAAITESKIRVNEKYQPAYDLDNLARFMLFSNEERAIPAEGSDERRFFALKAGDQHIQDTAYFGALVSEIDNGGAEAMLYDLMQFDHRRVSLRNPPKTEALAEQTEANLSGAFQWWKSVLEDGAFTDVDGGLSVETDKWETEAVKIDRKRVFDAYNDAVKTFGMVKADSARVGKFLAKVCPGVTTKKSGADRWYVFPALAECREAFANVTGVKVMSKGSPEDGETVMTEPVDSADIFWQAGHLLQMDADLTMIMAGGELAMEAVRWFRSGGGGNA